MVFDSNGMHKGNRHPGRARDVMLIEYSADKSNIWGGDIGADFFRRHPVRGHNPFDRFLAVRKKRWETQQTRTTTDWAESLQLVESWV